MSIESNPRPLFESRLLRIEDYRCPGRENTRGDETTDAYEIVLPRSGVFVRHDAHGKTVADANGVLFFNRGQPYAISHPVDGSDHSTIFSLQQALLLEMIRSSDPSVDERPDRPFILGHALVETPLRLGQYWLLHFKDLQNCDPVEVEEPVLALLSEVIRQPMLPGKQVKGSRYLRRSPGTRGEHAGLAERVKVVLSNRFSQRFGLDEIAREVYTSPYHLCRVFKHQTGITIHQYLQRLRLLHTLEMLVDFPKDSLSRIALDAGFSSHHHFTASFHKTFGFPPSDFRRRAREQDLREMRKILKA